MEIQVQDVHHFSLNNSFPYVNILRKWNKFCISFDFDKNEAQTAFNGRVSKLIRNPDANPNMKGQSVFYVNCVVSTPLSFIGSYDAKLISGASPNTQVTLIIGRYAFDKNPFIGIMADINVWDRWGDL